MVSKEPSLNLRDLPRIQTNQSTIFIGEGDDRKGSRMLGKGVPESSPDEQADEFGRVNKGPFTLRNGATYTGQWLEGMRDGMGTQLWPDGSRYEG